MNRKKKRETESRPEISLKFDGDGVEGEWFAEEISPVLCALCGKGCEVKCVYVNPYCG
jgi:hypothetical protein